MIESFTVYEFMMAGASLGLVFAYMVYMEW